MGSFPPPVGPVAPRPLPGPSPYRAGGLSDAFGQRDVDDSLASFGGSGNRSRPGRTAGGFGTGPPGPGADGRPVRGTGFGTPPDRGRGAGAGTESAARESTGRVGRPAAGGVGRLPRTTGRRAAGSPGDGKVRRASRPFGGRGARKRPGGGGNVFGKGTGRPVGRTGPANGRLLPPGQPVAAGHPQSQPGQPAGGGGRGPGRPPVLGARPGGTGLGGGGNRFRPRLPRGGKRRMGAHPTGVAGGGPASPPGGGVAGRPGTGSHPGAGRPAGARLRPTGLPARTD